MPRARSVTPDAFPETQYVPEEDDSQNMHGVECILDERGPKNKGEYLIKWLGIDPATSEPWKPTWEPKSGCTPALIAEWREKKKSDPRIIKLLSEREKRREVERKEVEERAATRRGKKTGTGAGKRKRDEEEATMSKRGRPTGVQTSEYVVFDVCIPY